MRSLGELLRMEHISKRFGSFYANKNITLTVNRGEVLTLLGENGAGKSTLMNILGCLSLRRARSFWRAKRFASNHPARR